MRMNRVLSLAHVVGGLSGGLTFARIDTLAMNLRFIGKVRRDGDRIEQQCRSRGERCTGGRLWADATHMIFAGGDRNLSVVIACCGPPKRLT